VTEGQTYDNKLHTFKELDYSTSWKTFEMMVAGIGIKSLVTNISTRRMMDLDISESEIAEDRPKYMGKMPDIGSSFLFNEKPKGISCCCSNQEAEKGCLIF
jgi:hypothetical protein